MNLATRGREQLELAKHYQEHMWNDHGERDIPPSLGFRFHQMEMPIDAALMDFLRENAETIDTYMDGPATENGGMSDMANSIGACLFVIQENVYEPEEDRMFRIPDGVTTGQIDLVIFLSSGYIRLDSPEAAEPEKGELAREFATNPDSQVQEVVQASIWERDAVGQIESVYAYQSFVIGDGGVLEWKGDPEVIFTDSFQRREQGPAGRIDSIVTGIMGRHCDE